MEELMKQLEEFFQLFWGGLISFVAVLVSAFAVYYHATRDWNLRLAIGYLALGITITSFLFKEEHTTFGVLAAVAETLALSVLIVRARARKHEEKVSPTSLPKRWWAQVVVLGAVMAALVWGIPWVAGYPLLAFFFLGVGLISSILFLSVIMWKQRRPRS